MAVKFTSHKGEIETKVKDATEKALRLVGGQAERFAKEKISDMKAVDTGFLRNSITFALGGKGAESESYTDNKGIQKGSYSGSAPSDSKSEHSVWIGSNVYYAPYVEFGTTKVDPRPFLSNSIQEHKNDFEDTFKDAFSHFK